ncbi:LysM peptidoglycan-binding domain-containing protein [Kurthia zopfii]|uniref:LysM peptidoglycan-binding domain-containing protein n=1 Tax=Kurthia zopfii TaxID=1650 RepID=UPI000F6EF0C8|nr:LysM peptidoglycan-binding domain-containing protein [Kurthia zopfii]VEI06120.1 Probable peptidoglycan endopeptidase LytE precursor [Kurthia zopfii]
MKKQLIAITGALALSTTAFAGAASAKEITIQSGDTLSELASTHNTTVSTLQQLNGLTTDLIFAGAQLEVGGNGVATQAPVQNTTYQAPVKQVQTQTTYKAPVQQKQAAPVQKAAPVQQAPTYKAPVKQAPVKQQPVYKAPVKKLQLHQITKVLHLQRKAGSHTKNLRITTTHVAQQVNTLVNTN